MAGAKPPLTIEIVWNRELEFGATSGATAIALDGNGAAGPSPVQLLGMALLGCMAADVVDILRKGRHPLTSLHASLSGERARESPRRLVTVAIHFAVHGDIPAAAVERAIGLSRDKYCSVWHSLRSDIELYTSYEVAP